MKQCTKCGQDKDVAQFYRDRKRADGLSPWCKDCYRAWQRSESGQHSNSAKGKRYRQTPAGKLANRQHISRFHKTPEGKAYNDKIRRLYPERASARQAVHRAVVAGKLPPVTTQRCVKCGKPAAHYHHHQGYDKPNRLNVIPVCVDCHASLDVLAKQNRAGAEGERQTA